MPRIHLDGRDGLLVLLLGHRGLVPLKWGGSYLLSLVLARIDRGNVVHGTRLLDNCFISLVGAPVVHLGQNSCQIYQVF
jgi:hypothetical protein